MQQVLQCNYCGAPVSSGALYCGCCGKQLNWGTQQSMPDNQDSPSMHISPLNYQTREPILYYINNTFNLPAVTTDGRLSWLPVPNNISAALEAKIQDRYPPQRYSGVQSYVMCAVVLRSPDTKRVAFIYEVWGFWEHMKEVDELYKLLFSLGNTTVGDTYWDQCIQYLSNDPAKTWINALIYFLKEQIHWAEYVDKTLAQL